jgi:hypothetical protein
MRRRRSSPTRFSDVSFPVFFDPGRNAYSVENVVHHEPTEGQKIALTHGGTDQVLTNGEPHQVRWVAVAYKPPGKAQVENEPATSDLVVR